MALTDNLISFWKLDETSGTTSYDSVASNDGTVTGATINVTGLISKAVDFDGLGDKIDTGSGIATAINGKAAWSFSGWFNLDVVNGDDGLFYFTDGGNGCWYFCTRPDGTNAWLGYKTANHDGYAIINTPFSGEADTWVHLAFTYTSGALKIYKNGSQWGSTITTPTGTVTATSDFVLGCYSSTSYGTDGTIDEVGVWDKELTSAEITSLYNSGSGWTYPLPAQVWLNIGDVWKQIV